MTYNVFSETLNPAQSVSVDYDNFWHKCYRESRQSKCTLFSHLTYLCFCTTWRNRKPENCVFSLKCCKLFTENTQNTLKYHLVTAEPPFTVKTIDWMHQTLADRT